MPKARTKRRRGKVSAKASGRRRRRRNAPPGVRAVGVSGYSRKKPKKAKKKSGTRRRRRRAKARRNPPTVRRRRRRAKSTLANPPKRRRRRKAKAGTKRRRRSKGKAKVTRRRRRRSTKATTRRRRRRARRNPVMRRRRRGLRARRNPIRGRRRRRGFRRNPVGGVVGTFKSRFKTLLQPQVWLPPAVHGAIGVGIANYGPTVLARFTGQLGLRNYGFGGVVLSGVSTVIGSGLASIVANKLPKGGLLGKATAGIARNIMVGGMIWTAIRLIGELSPGVASALYLPRAGGGLSGLGMYGGHYPGQYPSHVNLPGLGMVESPEALVAGESAYRQSHGGMGDWMELSGMGQPVPYQDIRGMGDWIELTPDAALAMDQSFNPGSNEAF